MKHSNLPLIIGIALPIVFIIIIAIVIYAPSFYIKPQHDFIYTTDNDYYGYNRGYKNFYKVKDGQIVTEPLATKPLQSGETYTYLGDAPTLYMYKVSEDSSHQITLEDAEKLSLDPGPSSPDGYTISNEYGHDGIFELFGSNGNNNGLYIFKDKGKKRLTGLSSDRYHNYYNFMLIGWVK